MTAFLLFERCTPNIAEKKEKLIENIGFWIIDVSVSVI